MTTAPTAYIICGTPRSGSTLLCEMLAASGVAGRPNSYYRSVTSWADRWNLPYPDGTETAAFDHAYLAAMSREGRAGTGIFGLRIMWASIAEAAMRMRRLYGEATDIVAGFEDAFGPALYIHLSRRDKVAQAVSLLRAERSGLWHLSADGSVLEGAAAPQDVVYDAARIAEIVAELESDDADWDAFFASNEITPLRLTYETLAADPRQVLADILAALGRDPAIARTVAVATSKMGDATSREWVERFKASR